MNKKYFIIAAVVLVVSFAGFKIYKKNQKPKVSYSEYKVIKGDIAIKILATGTVKPKNRLEIKAPVAGRIEQVLIKEGSVVRKGQILAWMSSTERAAMLDAARAKGADEYKKWSELYLATPVLAPISGTIILKSVEPGQTFTNTDAIFTMSDSLTVQALVDETDIAQIKLKNSASIILDAYPKFPITAHVDKLAFDSTTTNNVTTYAIEVEPDKIPDFMRSGMTANVTFSVQSKVGILLVPSEALKVVDGKSIVLKKGEPDHPPVETTISTGLSDGKQTELLEGLEEGDIILIQDYSIGDGSAASSNPFAPKFPKGGKKGGGMGGPR
ncbi:MAG: HlyD family efflux transporter periplasmic adaptor subunit [Bacteriovorax sp.]|nr:HlyD family efflux transporter periplasmic adaptor subunit [Bacteriovorax sp.]